MNIPVINPSSATVGVLFPPTLIPSSDLTAIYTKIVNDDKTYTAFNLLAQGARIGRSDGSYIHIEPNRLQVQDIIQDGSTPVTPFTIAKERIVRIFKIVFEKVHPQAFFVTGIKLVAQIDTNEQNGASKFLSNAVAPMSKEKIEYHLGQTLTGIGLRLSSKKEQPWQSVHELRIEPFFRDLSKIYVELDVQIPGPSQNIDALESQIEHVATYLKTNVKEFMGTL
jgi:hypothetical protein